MLSLKEKIYLFLWPKKILRSCDIKSIVEYISNNCKKNGLINKSVLYFSLKFCYSFVSNVVLLPLSLILYAANYRFIYGTHFQQIGEVFLLDIAIKENILNKKSKLILFYHSPLHDNGYLISLYKEHVIFIDKTWLFPILLPLSHSILTRIDVIDFDTHGRTGRVSRIFQEFSLQNNKNLIAMPADDITECKDLISHLVQERKFVCIHARESGYKNNFYQDLNRTTRNADINTYDLLIAKLIELDFVVVRLGDPSMQHTRSFEDKYKENFIDYAHSNLRSEKMDIYLLSNCDFLVACSSGPADVTTTFNKNTLILNGIIATNSLKLIEGDIGIFKKIVNVKTGKNLKLEKLFSYPFDQALQRGNLNDLGYYYLDNSRDEILGAFNDFMMIRKKSVLVNKFGIDLSEYFEKNHWCYNNKTGKYSASFIQSYVNNSE